MKYSVILSVFLLGCTVEQTVNNLDLYGQGKVFRQHSDKKLKEISRASIKEFKSNYEYYAAYAVNPVEDKSAWVSNHSLEKAKRQALDVCRLKSNNKSGCIIYATIIPKGYKPKNGKITLSQTATGVYRGKFQSALRESNFGAFAINEAADFGWATRPERNEAIKAALDFCKIGGANGRSKSSKTWKKYHTKEHYKCRIIDVKAR